MIKKVFTLLGIFIFAFVSFMFTEKTINVFQNLDPLKEEINKYATLNVIVPRDAIINGDEIIPGMNGKKVDIQKSYMNMRTFNHFTESLLEYKTIYPNITFKDNIDKYITSGNSFKQSVSIILEVNSEKLEETLKILEKNEVVVTFLINDVDENQDILKKISKTENEIVINYDNTLINKDDMYIIDHRANKFKNVSSNICITTSKSENLINTCKNSNKSTILLKESQNFASIKNTLSNGNIIYINNLQNTSELSSIIALIKSKGLNIEHASKIILETL